MNKNSRRLPVMALMALKVLKVRTVLRVAASVALLAVAGAAHAQAFAAKPIKLIVGFAPGGAVDIIARAVGQQIGTTLGQPVMVENRPGAGSGPESIVKLNAASRSKANSMSYGNPGNGSTPHLATPIPIPITITNTRPVRALDIAFTPPVVQLETGCLMSADSRITALADVGRPGIRVGVAQGSTAPGVLPRDLKQATVLAAAEAR